MLVIVLFFPLSLLSFKLFLAMLARVKTMDVTQQSWIWVRIKVTFSLIPFLMLPLTLMILLGIAFFDTLLVLEWETSFVVILVILSVVYLVFRKLVKKALFHLFIPELLRLYETKALAQTKFNSVYPALFEAYIFPVFIFLIAYQI